MARAPRTAVLPRPLDFVAFACVAMAATLVFRGALHYGFSQDDFVGLARAGGLVPPLAGPWRWLSQQMFWEALRNLAGLDARPYHLVSLAAHALAAVLCYEWLARFAARAGALVGAAFFACHAAAFTALYWASAFGDIGALVFALLALLFAAQGGRVRWLALPAFAASLLCKESTLFLPFVAWAAGAQVAGRARRRRPDAPPGGLKDPLVRALFAIAIGFAAWLALAGSGTAPGVSPNAAYAVAFGGNLGVNLLTYLGWMANAFVPTVHAFTDGVDPGAFAPGAVLLVVLVAGNFVPAFRRRGWGAASVWVVAMLAPVLVLRNHVYHYYAYAAVPGVAWMLGIGFDVAIRRRSATIERAALAAVFVAALCANGAALVHKIETAPFVLRDSRSDPTVDRALVAARALASVEAAHVPPHDRLWFWSPARMLEGGRPTPLEQYAERNVKAALEGGLGVRVIAPQLDTCAFVDAPVPGPPTDRFAIFHLDGSATIVARSTFDSLLTQIPAAPATPTTP